MIQGNSHSRSLLVRKELTIIFLEGSLVTGTKNHKIVPNLKPPWNSTSWNWLQGNNDGWTQRFSHSLCSIVCKNRNTGYVLNIHQWGTDKWGHIFHTKVITEHLMLERDSHCRLVGVKSRLKDLGCDGNFFFFQESALAIRRVNICWVTFSCYFNHII